MDENKKKRKVDPNLLLCVACALFVVLGLFGECALNLGKQGIQFGKDLLRRQDGSFTKLIEQVETISSEDLRYHRQLMDINSLYMNFTGTEIAKKDGSSIVKSESGKLFVPAGVQGDWGQNQIVQSIQGLQQVAEENGSAFLYALAPTKNNFVTPPPNVEDHERENLDRLIQKVHAAGIPYIDLREGMEAYTETPEDLYFTTDHHWTAFGGFLANRLICEELSSRYGFELRKEALAPENYNVETYEDYFLGSYGKKMGTYFAKVDDFDLITPKFSTDMTEEQPIKNQFREGTFEETALYMENLARKDYYNLNPYATYCGGDFRLQILKDRMNPEGKKILVIRDSFAGAVCPFMALQFGEVHIMDIRNFSYYIGEKMDIPDYIRENKPDYVLVLYGVTELSAGQYNFLEP